jgi:Transcriptional regulator PadR-like family
MHKRDKRLPCSKIVLKLPDLDHAKSAVLNSLSSPHSRRNYKLAMDEFIAWYRPAVQQLETAGLITHREQFGKKGQIRKIYRPTRSGRERLKKWRINAKPLILASASEFPLWRVDSAPTSITAKLLKKWSTAELTLQNRQLSAAPPRTRRGVVFGDGPADRPRGRECLGLTCLTRRTRRPGHKDTVRPRPCTLGRRSLPDLDLGQSRKHAYPRERAVSHVWRQAPGFMLQASCPRLRAPGFVPQASCFVLGLRASGFGGAITIRNHRRKLNRGAVFPSSYGIYPFHNPDKAAHPGCGFKLRSLGLDEIVRGLPKRKNNA